MPKEQDLHAELYTAAMKEEWDAYVDSSRNATFLLRRDYMDYHSDRFTDCSLIIRHGDKPVALLPASRHGSEARSHGGLTYGGLVLPPTSRGQEPLYWFETIASFYREMGIERLLYKPIPHIYHISQNTRRGRPVCIVPQRRQTNMSQPRNRYFDARAD